MSLVSVGGRKAAPLGLDLLDSDCGCAGRIWSWRNLAGTWRRCGRDIELSMSPNLKCFRVFASIRR